MRDFRNLRSNLYQWIFAQDQLETSFQAQKEAAQAEIFERYLQIKSLKEQNCEM